MEVDRRMAIELIEEKKKADAPIYTYKDFLLQKGQAVLGLSLSGVACSLM